MQEYFKTRRDSTIIIFILLSFAFGIYIGSHNKSPATKVIDVENIDNTVSDKIDFGPFWKVWNLIDEKSPSAADATAQKRVYGAISGLMSSLNDPYSVFFAPDEAKMFEDQIAGNFSGIGMEVGMKDKVLTVIAPIKDTPAYKAGIKTGDKILKIDKTVTNNMEIDQAIKLIRGEKGTTVSLTILHDKDTEPVELKIVRDIINIPTLDSELRPDGIFVIHLYSFTANSANLFRDAMKKFVDTKSNKLILDLRGNPGGYLDAAVDISSWFLPGGQTVVTEDYGPNREPTVYRSKGYNIFDNNLKFAILVDGGSASASEIVSGAMQDHKKAVLVGSQSFGKGSVQETIKVTPDTLLKITVAKWLTPDGHLIHGTGLTPDYKVEFTKANALAKKDPQMDKAAELLNK